jgi:hypothetical protein
MSIKLEDYEEFLAQAPAVRSVLENIFQDAARIMSPAGLQTYMDGARALCKLGRGSDLVVTYLEEMPQVVKECGEDIIPDCLTAAMKLSSMTSGEVISLLFSSLPSAARNLGDAELLRGYLTFIHQLASTAARGLRPMLNHMDELLSKLTLSGLRRWAQFGAQAYRRDFNNLTSYFNLESADSTCAHYGHEIFSSAPPVLTTLTSGPILKTAYCICLMPSMISMAFPAWNCTAPPPHTWLRTCVIPVRPSVPNSSARHRCFLSG